MLELTVKALGDVAGKIPFLKSHHINALRKEPRNDGPDFKISKVLSMDVIADMLLL